MEEGIGILLKKAMSTFKECYFRPFYLPLQLLYSLGFSLAVESPSTYQCWYLEGR